MVAHSKLNVVFFLVCSLIIVGWIVWEQDRQYKAEELKSAVYVTVEYNARLCNEEYPLLVKVVNKSGKTLERLNFSIEGRLPGSNELFFESGHLEYSIDRMLIDGEGWAKCWRPALSAREVGRKSKSNLQLEALVWTIKRVEPMFRG